MLKHIIFGLLISCCPCAAYAESPSDSDETEQGYTDPSTADSLPDEILEGLDQLPHADQDPKEIILPNGYNAQEFRDHFEKGTPLRELPRSQPTIHPRENSDNTETLMK